jgi:hypothetical protein
MVLAELLIVQLKREPYDESDKPDIAHHFWTKDIRTYICRQSTCH